MKRWHKIPLVGLALLLLPITMTSVICHPRFFMAWSADGQCGASDAPSEVFLSFLVLSVLVFLPAIAIIYWVRAMARKGAK